MKIAICDDDKKAADILMDILHQYPNPLEKIDVYFSGEEFLKQTETYDLLFLDIDMKGMDGIETARRIRLRDRKLKIVYVTAYSEYGGRAFSVHAFGYLLKPVTKKKILAQVEDARTYQEEEQEKSPLLEFSTKGGLIFLHPEEIYFFEFSGRRIFITARDGTYEMGGRLKDVKDRMEEYGFASPHKSFVVNLGEIKNMRGYEIYMTNGTVIPLAQKQSPLFKEILSKYLAGRRK